MQMESGGKIKSLMYNWGHVFSLSASKEYEIENGARG